MGTGAITDLLLPLRGREDEVIARIEDWSNINSGSTNVGGLARMAALLSADLKELTADVAVFPLPDAEEPGDNGTPVKSTLGPVVRAVCRPDAPVQVLLNGHFDTVFGPDHSFQEARREGGRLIGPGVTDMKGGLAVMIESLRILESASFRHGLGWEVILNPDEEIGSPGSAEILVAAASRHQVGLVFESALPDGNLVSGRLGIGNFLIRLVGQAAHVGRDFKRGRSAVVALADLIGAFHRLNQEKGIILNIGRIAGGGALNIVPAQASCRLNVRVESLEKARLVEDRIRELAAEAGGKHEVEVVVEGRFGRPPKPVTPALEFVLGELRLCARGLGFDLAWAPTGGGSDGNNLAAAGLTTVDSLGVRGGGIHTDSEFLEVESVAERISLCACFLLKLARGDLVLSEEKISRPPPG